LEGRILPRLSFVRKYSGKIFGPRSVAWEITADGTDPWEANRRINAELTAATDAPPPHRRGARLLGKLRQRFPETSFHIDGTSGIDGSGRWTGSDHARVVWTDGPTKTTISTVVTARRAHSNRPQLSLTLLTKLDPVS
jgi:hypothetical protein